METLVSPTRQNFTTLHHRDSLTADGVPSQLGGVRSPLLEAQPHADRLDTPHRRPTLIGVEGGRSRVPRWTAVLNSRTRLHPLMLLPCFVLGAFCAASGMLGSSLEGKARMHWPSYDVSL